MSLLLLLSYFIQKNAVLSFISMRCYGPADGQTCLRVSAKIKHIKFPFQLFDFIDEDHSDFIDADEVDKLMTLIGVSMSRDQVRAPAPHSAYPWLISAAAKRLCAMHAQINAMIKDVDTDCSGKIDFDEFLQVLCPYWPMARTLQDQERDPRLLPRRRYFASATPRMCPPSACCCMTFACLPMSAPHPAVSLRPRLRGRS